MRLGRIVMGSLVGAALIAGSITPAMARDGRWDRGYGRGWDRHHRGNGFGFGDAVGITALLGAAVLVANSMKKDRDSRDRSYEGDNSNPNAADGGTSTGAGGGYAEDSAGSRAGDRADDYAGKGDIASEDAAVDACAVAARDKASSGGTYAEVKDIGHPQATGNGGWNIDGSVEQRSGYRDGSGKLRGFTCTVKDGRVAEVYLARDPATI